MRAFTLLLAITIAAADSPNDACPAVDGPFPVYLPHKDCNKYYECSNGVAYLFICDGNLVFNRELNVCDWPSNVNCTSNGTDSGDVPPEPEPANEATTENSHRATSKAPLPAESTTERWLTFSVETTSENSGDITTFLPDETTESASIASTESDESSSDSHRSSDESRESTSATESNESSSDSHRSSEANSDDLTTFLPDETTETPSTTSAESNESSSDSHRSSEESRESTSAASTDSNASSSDSQTSSEENSDDLTTFLPDETTETPSTTSAESNESSSDSHKSSEESKENSSSESSESNESSSDSRKSSKESKESSSSESSESSESSSDSSESSENARDCRRHRNGFFLRPHPSSCTKYIACDHGKVDIMPCPDGLYFNPIIHVCVEPKLSGCKLEPLAA